MELKKGQNIIEHEAEIFSRPARTWFQTGVEKEASEGQGFTEFDFHSSDSSCFIAVSKQQYEVGMNLVDQSKQKKVDADNKVICSFLSTPHC